jgi:mannose-1-phosphate guanylyltransferase
MKAVLLAGGFGSRARPFSDYCPKALIPIDGRPVIDHVIRYISKYSFITEILVVCEFDSFGKQIINYFDGKENIIGIKITFIEDKKRGTGGALLECQEKLKDEQLFLVWFSDNLCALNLDRIVLDYNNVNILNKFSPIGLLIARKKRHEETGRVILNANNNDDKNNINLIKQFTEKPTIDLEYPEATGIYIFNNRFLDILKLVSKENEGKSFDLSKDVLSKIDYYTKDRLYCYLLRINETNWVDIESPTYIERNKKTIEGIISQMESVKQNDSLLNKKPID